MKDRIKRLKQFFNKYINGTKGVISLFLVMIMLPFTSIALLLVESARYQNALELVDEMLDCVGLSSIAEFDSYLEDRFGLLAVSQETGVDESFNKYLSANVPALDNSFKYTSATAKGVYPLADNKEVDVLKTQILEYSEITVMAEALYNGLKVDDLLEKLYEQMGVEELNEIAEATGKVADVATSIVGLADAVKGALEEYEKYAKQLSEYKAAVKDFHTKAETLINELNTAQGNLEEDDDPDDIYDVKAVKNAIKECEKARDTFKKEAKEMASSVGKMKAAVEKMFTTADKITANIQKANGAMDKVSGTTVQDQCTTSTAEWLVQIADELTKTLATVVSQGTYAQDMQNQVNLLNSQAVKVGTIVCDKASDGDTSKYYIDVNSDIATVKSDFAAVSINSIKGGFQDILEGIVEKLESKDDALSEDKAVGVGKLLDLASAMLKVTLFYDSSLDANVSTSAFHRYDSGDMSFTSERIINSLTTIVNSGDKFVTSLAKLNLLKALEAAAEFLYGVGEFLVAIVSWVVEAVVGLVKFIASGTEMYDTFLLSAYSIYTMPCRTTYWTGETLTGYSYKQNFYTMGGVKGNAFTGSMADLETLQNKAPGSDPGFRGAEVEYLLIGSPNELLNQSATFFNLYMTRLVVNLIPIFRSAQIKAMATAATVASWAVYIAIIIAEPMIDALLLVNEQDVPLIKDKEWLYLTPAGMVYLLTILPKLSGLSGSTQNMLKDAVVAANGNPPKKGSYFMNYQEHMLVLLLLMVPQDKLVARIANVVQMEAAEHYKTSFKFDLDKSYTYIEANVTGTLNSMFDMDALTEDGPFTISRKRIIGY